MSIYEFVTRTFPDFAGFLGDMPEWYKAEMDYPVARRLLDFAVELYKHGEQAELKRLMEYVEAGMGTSDDISGPLCLDFVQPIADLKEYRDPFLQLIGPKGRECYDAQ